MTRILKCFLIISLLLSSFSHSVRLDIHAENEPVDCDITFTENGFVVTSSDQEFLASIESIEINQDDLSVKFTSTDWTILDDELVIQKDSMCGVFHDGEADVTVFLSINEQITETIQLSGLDFEENEPVLLNEPELMEVPAYTVEFSEYGLIIQAENQDYLNAISSIRLYCTSDRGNDMTFSSNEWIVKDKEIFLPCKYYVQAKLVYWGYQQITLTAAGYQDSTKGASAKLSRAADLELSMNENRDIVISSSDDYWLRLIAENQQDDRIWVYDSSGSYSTSISNEELVYQDGKVLIPYEVQCTKYMFSGKVYKFSVQFNAIVETGYKIQDLGELRLTYGHLENGYDSLIEPYEITIESDGYGLIIRSENDDYLRSVDQIRFSLIDRYVDHSEDVILDESQWILRDNEIYLPCYEYLAEGIIQEEYYLILSAPDFFDKAYAVEIEGHHALNVRVTMNQHGDIVILSDDSHWLKSLVEKEDNQVIQFVPGRSFANTDLIYENGTVLIPHELLTMHEGQMFEIESWGPYPYAGQKLGEITLTKPQEGFDYDELLEVPDYTVEIDRYGINFISDDLEFLTSLNEIEFYTTSSNIKSGIIVKKSEWELEENRLFVPCEQFLSQGMDVNNHHTIVVSAQGYLDSYRSEYFEFFYPRDVKVSENEFGDLLIESSDDYWLRMLKGYDSSRCLQFKNRNNVVLTLTNDDLIYQDGKIIVPASLLQNKLKNGIEYKIDSYFVSEVYYGVTLGNIVLQSTIKSNPTDVSVGLDKKTGSIVISSSSEEWENGLITKRYDTDLAAVNVYVDGVYRTYFTNNMIYHDLIMENGKIVISADKQKEAGLYTGEIVELEICSKGYNKCVVYSDIKITHGIRNLPDDVKVSVDEKTGNLLITSKDKEWLKNVVVNYDESSGVTPFIQMSNDKLETYFFNEKGNECLVLSDKGIVISNQELIERGIPAGSYDIIIYANGYSSSATITIEVLKGAVQVPEDTSIVEDEQGNLVILSSNQAWLEEIVKPLDQYAPLGIYNDNTEAIFYNWVNETCFELHDGKVILLNESLKTHSVVNGTYLIKINILGYTRFTYENVEITKGAKVSPEDIEYYLDDSGNLIVQSSDEEWLQELVYVSSTHPGSIILESVDSESEWVSFGRQFEEDTTLVLNGNQVIVPEEMLKLWLESGTYRVFAQAHGYAETELGTIELETDVLAAPTDVQISVNSKGHLKIKSSNKKWLKSLVNDVENGFTYISFLSGKTYTTIQNHDGKTMSYSDGTVTITNEVLKELMIPNDHYEVSILVEGYGIVYVLDFDLKKSVDYVPDDLTVVQNEEGMIQICTENQSYLKNISSIGLILSGKKIKLKDDEVHVETGSLNVPLDTLLKYGVAENQEIQLKISSKNYQNAERNLTVHTGAEIINEPVEIGFDEYGNLLIMSENQDYLDSIQRVVVALKIDTGNVQYELTQRKDTASGVIFYTGSIKEDMTEVEADLTVYSYGYECLNESQVMIDSVDGIKSVEQRVYVGDQLTLEATNLPNQKVTWSTSDKNIATVDKNGVVKFLKAGTVKITGKAYGKSMKVTLVCESIKLSVSASSTKPIVGDVIELNVTNSTDRDIIWTVSNENVVVLNEETLTVEAVGPGSATVSAKINGVTKSVKFTVYTVESGAKLKSEVVDYDKAGMELGEVKTLNIFTNKSEETINEHMKFKSSNTKVATVDEDGNITAIAKGTAKITAAVANDPDGRKITVEVKVIDRQARAIEVVIDDEAVERNGNELLIDYEVVGKNYKIALDEILYDREGLQLNTAVTWSTSDSKVASIKASSGINYLTINGGGQVILTGTVKDLRKESIVLTLRVMEYAPRLETSKVTINKYSQEAAELKIYTAYDTTVSEVRVLEYNKSTKKYEETDNFSVKLNEGKAYLKADESVKKGTYKIQLITDVDNGRSYGYELSASVTETLPSPTIKVSGYINTFNLEESALALRMDHKGNVVTGIELDGTDAFLNNFSIDEEGNVEIHGLEKEANGKLTLKGTLRIYYEGYTAPVEKSVTFTTKSVKPSWKLSVTSITISKSGREPVGASLIDSKTKEIIDLDDSYRIELISGNAEEVYLDIDSDMIMFNGIEKSSTQKVEVTHESWTAGLTFSLKTTVTTSLPKVKLSSSVSVHREFKPEAVMDVKLDQGNVLLDGGEIKPVKATSETEKLEVFYSEGQIYVTVLDNSIKSGSYKYSFAGVCEDGTELKAVTFTVKVDTSEPTYKLSKTSIKLNKALDTFEQIVLTESLSKNTHGIAVQDIEVRLAYDKKYPEQSMDDVMFAWSEEGIAVSLNNPDAKGKYSYYLRPIYDGGVLASKEVKLSVEIIDKAASLKTSVSGSINPIDPESAAKVKVTFSNLVDTVASVELEDERFEAEVVDGVIEVSLKDGEVLSNATVSLNARITTETTGTEFETVLKVKVARSAPKITVSPSTLNLYNPTKNEILIGSVELTLKGNGKIVELVSQNKESLDKAFRVQLREESGELYADVYLLDAANVKAGSTTSLKYQVIFKGESDMKKAPSITIKVADKSTSVKWSVLDLFR